MSQKRPTIVVLTALPLEYDAVRSYLPEREELLHGGTRVERGRLPGTDWDIALHEMGEGNGAAAALTTRLVSWLKAEAVLFVGVAGSLKADIGIGDVVVGTHVYGIHGGKETPDGFQVRPKAWQASHALEQAARSAVRDMPGVRVHFKPIASGDVVLAHDTSALARHVRKQYNDAAAIEMEGAGTHQAAHLSGQVDALVIRGISDRADTQKDDADAAGSQEKAARQAALVTMAVLRKHRPRESASDKEEPQRQ